MMHVAKCADALVNTMQMESLRTAGHLPADSTLRSPRGGALEVPGSYTQGVGLTRNISQSEGAQKYAQPPPRKTGPGKFYKLMAEPVPEDPEPQWTHESAD